MKTFGSLFFVQVYPANIEMSIQIRFFERASLGKTISDPKGKKLWYPFFNFWSLLSTTSTVHEGLRVKTFGSLFLYKYILAGSNIETSIQIRFFERASLGKTISDPKGKKLWYPFFNFWSLLSTTSTVHEGLRVKTFGSLFLYKYILAGSNIETSIQIRFFERASLGKTISDPKGKNNGILSLFFSSLLSTTSIVYEGLRVKTFGSLFLYKYTGSNIEMSIQLRFF